jgi:hypothetical protein
VELFLASRAEWRTWLDGSKRDDTRLRRIQKIVGIAEKNIRPGMI